MSALERRAATYSRSTASMRVCQPGPMELKNISQIEQATRFGRPETFRFGGALLFVIGIMLAAGMSLGDIPQNYMLITAAMVAGCMAMNIGANDVPNNVGPAVGSKALTVWWATRPASTGSSRSR
jgi:PiT family inorganic phosphate transporter